MIQGITLRNLRNAEFLQFSKDVLNIVNNNNSGNALQVTIQAMAFQNITSEIDALFAEDQGSDITPVIQDIDLRRDNAIQGITMLLNSYLLHFNPELRTAALKLSDHLKLYGNGETGIAKQNYPAETASISHILAEWNNNSEFAAAINTLELAAWKEELNTANEEFNNLYMARTQQIAAQNPDKLREKREQSVQAYYALRDRIVAFATINDRAEPWGKAVKELNALIEQYNVILAGRATPGNNSTDEAAGA